MGGVNLGDPVPIFHEEFAGASSKSLAIVVLEIFVSESDSGGTLVVYSTRRELTVCPVLSTYASYSIEEL